jgi:hypothetical protein|nr:MAG TPA: outer membrane protein [Caudoviricetes sp.]
MITNKNQKMKTIKLFATAAILFTLGIGSAKAQSSPDLEFGIKAGVNFSTLKTGLSAINDKSGKIGFNAGVFARAGQTIYFQPEINYVTFSDKYRFNSNAYEAKFRQLNVPLMVGYKFVNTADLVFRVSAGPDLYYNLKKPIAPEGFKYKDFSAGGVINAGVDIGSLTFDARYSLGLSKVNKDLGQKANIFSLGVGFKFQ